VGERGSRWRGEKRRTFQRKTEEGGGTRGGKYNRAKKRKSILSPKKTVQIKIEKGAGGGKRPTSQRTQKKELKKNFKKKQLCWTKGVLRKDGRRGVTAGNLLENVTVTEKRRASPPRETGVKKTLLTLRKGRKKGSDYREGEKNGKPRGKPVSKQTFCPSREQSQIEVTEE